MAGFSDFETWFLKIQFGGKARLSIYRKLAQYMKDGLPLTQALETMWTFASYDGKKPKTVQAVVLADWLEKTRSGKSLGDAIQGWVPHNDAVVISSGEQAGKIEAAFKNAIMINQAGRQIKSALIGGLLYPVVLIGAAVAFMWMFGMVVIPSFDAVRPREEWIDQGAQMAWLADFVANGLAQTIGAFFAAVIVFIWSLPRWTGKIRAALDPYAPLSIYRLVAGSGFLLSLSALIAAGVKVPEVLEKLKENATPWYHERISAILENVEAGKGLGEAVYLTGLNFPDRDTVNDLRSYANLSNFDAALEQLGVQNLQDTIDQIKAQAVVMRNVGVVVLGGVFGWLYLGIMSLVQQVTVTV